MLQAGCFSCRMRHKLIGRVVPRKSGSLVSNRRDASGRKCMLNFFILGAEAS